MKIAILEFDTRNNNEVINYAIDTNKKYCKMHNYDFYFDHLDVSKSYWFDNLTITDDLFRLRLYYHRFEMFEKYFKKYDYLVSFDSDVIVNNPNIKIEDLVDNDHHIFMSQDLNVLAPSVHIPQAAKLIDEYCKNNNKQYLDNQEFALKNIKMWNQSIFHCLFTIVTNPNAYNCGFIIIKCSDIIKEFINDFKKYYPLFDDATYDQGCVGLLLQTKKYKNIVKCLPYGTQGNPYFNVLKFNEETSFLCHFSGHINKPDAEAKQLLTKIRNNKWWLGLKVAILGAGQLGKELYEVIKEKYLCDLYSHDNFDICNNMQLDEIVKTHDFIINCVANINADKIEYDERERAISYNVNFLAVKNLAMLCKFYDKKLVHISSDYVYGSNDYNEILNEEYKCNPINLYGTDKLAGENAIINEQLNNYLILRVAWLVGKYGNNNFIEKIKNKINENNEIKVVDDQIGNITSTKTIIEVIEKYLNNEIPNGIYNVQNNDEAVSRYDIAKFIIECLNSKCKIINCKSNDYITPAKRQLNSNLCIEKIKKYCNIIKWKDVIKDYLNVK